MPAEEDINMATQPQTDRRLQQVKKLSILQTIIGIVVFITGIATRSALPMFETNHLGMGMISGTCMLVAGVVGMKYGSVTHSYVFFVKSLLLNIISACLSIISLVVMVMNLPGDWVSECGHLPPGEELMKCETKFKHRELNLALNIPLVALCMSDFIVANVLVIYCGVCIWRTLHPVVNTFELDGNSGGETFSSSRWQYQQNSSESSNQPQYTERNRSVVFHYSVQ